MSRIRIALLAGGWSGEREISLKSGEAVYHALDRGKYDVVMYDPRDQLEALMEAKDEKRLLRFQKLLANYELLIVDELGFVPLSKTGAEMLFEIFSLRYERGATMVTSNLPFNEWTEVLGSERLTGALLDRLTHHVHILEMNGESYRLKESKRNRPNKAANRSSIYP